MLYSVQAHLDSPSEPDAMGESSNLQTHSKYPIYDVNIAGRVNSIQTAAQFGDKAYIVSTLEKTPDADVNAMVQIRPSTLGSRCLETVL